LLLCPSSAGLSVGVSDGDGLSFSFAGFVIIISNNGKGALFSCNAPDLYQNWMVNLFEPGFGWILSESEFTGF